MSLNQLLAYRTCSLSLHHDQTQCIPPHCPKPETEMLDHESVSCIARLPFQPCCGRSYALPCLESDRSAIEGHLSITKCVGPYLEPWCLSNTNERSWILVVASAMCHMCSMRACQVPSVSDCALRPNIFAPGWVSALCKQMQANYYWSATPVPGLLFI